MEKMYGLPKSEFTVNDQSPVPDMTADIIRSQAAELAELREALFLCAVSMKDLLGIIEKFFEPTEIKKILEG